MKRFIMLMAAVALWHMPLAGQEGAEVPFNGLVETLSGEGVARMSVQVKGTEKRTSTDRDGRFGLIDVPADAVLVLSHRGETWEVPLDGRRSIHVVLSEQGVAKAEESEDLISLGFAFVKRREYNYSSDVITGEELRRSGQSDLESALLGRVAGLVRVNGELSIRGITTSGGDVRPLYLVDGVETMSLEQVNIDDVESVSVIKDASMYGARGAGGVISVKTHRR